MTFLAVGLRKMLVNNMIMWSHESIY